MTDTTTAQPDIGGALDLGRVQAFAGKVVGFYNGAMTTIQISIGHRVMLFDTMAELGAATSQELADAAKCDERYVREWLAVMVTAGIVERDRESDTYLLPAEHAALMTRSAGIDNLATLASMPPMLGRVQAGIEDCFHNGGGLGYDNFEEFHAWMAEQSAQTNDVRLLDTIVPLVDGLPGRLAEGIDVLDVGCGWGHAMNLLAASYPNSRFRGLDFSAPAIEVAQREAAELRLSNVTFDLADAADLPDVDAYDFITTFDAVHDQAQPQRVLNNIARALRPDGAYLAVDMRAASDVSDNIDHPLGPFQYGASIMHCMTVSLADGGAGLGTMWGEQTARKMFAEAGFSNVQATQVEGDIVNTYYICRPA